MFNVVGVSINSSVNPVIVDIKEKVISSYSTVGVRFVFNLN